MSKLVPCGDFPTEDECVNVLGIVFSTLPIDNLKLYLYRKLYLYQYNMNNMVDIA